MSQKQNMRRQWFSDEHACLSFHYETCHNGNMTLVSCSKLVSIPSHTVLGSYCQILSRCVRSGCFGLKCRLIEAYWEPASVCGCAVLFLTVTPQPQTGGCLNPRLGLFCSNVKYLQPFCVWEDMGWEQAGLLCVCSCRCTQGLRLSESAVSRSNRELGAVPSLLCKVLPLPVWLAQTA